mmetsp:Transcript_17135/g.56063  ORF Transcript_17135/g.56063 Transcript_17135/m.56063 type:complete len:539 (-) Transcript_17135:7-1623(-)
MKLGAASGDHAAEAVFPENGLAELAREERLDLRGIREGLARDVAKDGDARLVEGDLFEHALERLARLSHAPRVEGARYLQPLRALRTCILRRFLQRLERGVVAGDRHPSREEEIRGLADHRLLAPELAHHLRTQRVEDVELEPDHREHPPLRPVRPHLGHRLAAHLDHAQRILPREHARVHKRSVLSDREPANRRRARVRPGMLNLHEFERADRGEEDARLRVLREIHLLARPFDAALEEVVPHNPGRFGENVVARVELGEAEAHSDGLRPLPREDERDAVRRRCGLRRLVLLLRAPSRAPLLVHRLHLLELLPNVLTRERRARVERRGVAQGAALQQPSHCRLRLAEPKRSRNLVPRVRGVHVPLDALASLVARREVVAPVGVVVPRHLLEQPKSLVVALRNPLPELVARPQVVHSHQGTLVRGALIQHMCFFSVVRGRELTLHQQEPRPHLVRGLTQLRSLEHCREDGLVVRRVSELSADLGRGFVVGSAKVAEESLLWGDWGELSLCECRFRTAVAADAFADKQRLREPHTHGLR